MEAASEESSACWISSTNWIVAEGFLKDSISFETSTTPDADDDDGGATASKDLLLLRPQPMSEEDPLPCEITICFKGKHEIHSIYMRSTARVYEIYYASDHQNSSKEYLCTVRCGAAAKEVTPPSVTEGAANGCQGSNKGTAVVLEEQVVRSDSNNSDEDGWVQVKVPDSPLQDDRVDSLPKRSDGGIASPKMQIHYEATAEISDCPCVSLTLRLLSIQTKACVHVEDIYIYADPVESTNLDPPVIMGENLGGSSLLAMLVPSLLQLSKSGTSRMQDKCFSDESEVSKYQCGTKKTAQTISPDMERTVAQEAYSCMFPDQKLGPVQEPGGIRAEKTELGSSQKVTDPNQVPKSFIDQNNNLAYSRIEKVLDELVSRVGRVEAFCSRFEENMMKPLGCIETRLKRLEQQLGAFALRSQSSGQFPCSRISAPEFLFDESDSDSKGFNTKYTAASEDTTFLDTSSPADEVTASVPESQTRPGLVVKAPEFPNEDDECTNTDDTLDSLVTEDFPKDNKSMSIDAASAAALAAFLTSTTVKSPKPTPSLMEIPQESFNGNNSALDSSTVRVPSEGASILFKKSVFEDNGCDLLDAVRKGTCFGDSSLLTHDEAAPDNKFIESDMQKKDCDTSDAVRATFSGSLLVADDDVASPVFSSQLGTGLIVIVPEFLNDDGSLNCYDNLDSPVRDCLEDRASMPTVNQSLSPLAAFQSSTMVQSPKTSLTLLNISSGLSNVDSNELAASIIEVPSEGADESGIANHEENEMKGKVDLDPILKLLPPKVSLEQKEHDNRKCKYSAVDMEAPDGAATSNRMLHKGILEQKDYDGVKSNEWHSIMTTDKGLFTQNLLHCTGVGLNGGVSQNCDGGGWTDGSDAEEAVTSGLNRLGRGWTEGNSSTSSSFDENFIKNRVDIEWSDGSSSDSSRGAFTIIDHSKWQAAAGNDGSAAASGVENKTISHTGFTTGTCQASAGCSQEKSNTELARASSTSILNYDDMINNMKFAPEKNWISGLPLEVLLGEMPDEVHKAAAKGGDEDGIATGEQQHNSSSSQGIDWKAKAVGGLLLEVEDLTLTEASSLADEGLPQGPAGSSNPQLFSSLI